jgi:pyruvate/2-oxoglutarate dehydrogenase complex dihydrolipoamide dehydrogenase (E3) component
LNAEPTRVDGLSRDAVAVTAKTANGERKFDGSDLMVAVGRIPNNSEIGLDKAGVELDARGLVRVNERLETTAPGVWAIGECAGTPQFTHISVDDFRIVRDNMAGGNRRTDDRQVPYVMFTDPPLARVGLSEGEAQRQGVPARVSRLPMSQVLRTEATDEKTGFMKALVSANDDRILGFTMIGAEAGEVMATVQTAMMAGLPFAKLRDAVFSHLTMSEGLGSLFASVPGRSA